MDTQNQATGFEDPEGSTDTLQSGNAPAPTADDGNAGQTGQNASRQAPDDDNGHADDEAEKRASGKLKQTQEELKRAQKELNQAKQRFGVVEQYLTRTPDSYKEALMVTSGLTEAQAEAQVRLRFPDWKSGKATTSSQQPVEAQTTQPTMSAEEQAEYIRVVMARDEFLSENPDLSDDERADVLALAQTKYMRGTNAKEAFSQAKKTVLGTQEAYIEGKGQSLASTPSSQGAAAKNAQRQTGTSYEMTEADESILAGLGLADNEDAKKAYMSKMTQA